MDQLSPQLQAERNRCVASDAARKRSSRRWTNSGMSPPASLLRRETEEFDCRHGLLPAHPPPPPPPVYHPPPPPPPPAGPRRQIRFDSGASSSCVASSSSAPRTPPRRAAPPPPQRRRLSVEELDELLYQQGLAQSREWEEKQQEWKLIHEEQAALFVDLISDDEE